MKSLNWTAVSLLSQIKHTIGDVVNLRPKGVAGGKGGPLDYDVSWHYSLNKALKVP